MRREAPVAHTRESNPGGFPSLARRRGLGLIGSLLALVGPLLVRAWAGGDEAPSDAPLQVQTAAVAPIPAAGGNPPRATVATPQQVEARPGDEQRRRLLMLLLTRSAGPVRPYGNIGH
jgi:hypothetical protein